MEDSEYNKGFKHGQKLADTDPEQLKKTLETEERWQKYVDGLKAGSKAGATLSASQLKELQDFEASQKQKSETKTAIKDEKSKLAAVSRQGSYEANKLDREIQEEKARIKQEFIDRMTKATDKDKGHDL